MAMNQASNGTMQSEINVTPMIDVLLVLLIIFMVIVPVTSRGESARVPRPATHESRAAAVVLEVLKGGPDGPVFRVNQQTISREDLGARLAQIYANRADRVLFVKGDDQLSFRQIAEAMDVAHAAGISDVGLITPNTAFAR